MPSGRSVFEFLPYQDRWGPRVEGQTESNPDPSPPDFFLGVNDNVPYPCAWGRGGG